MKVAIDVNNSSSDAARYLTWAPSPLRLKLLEAPQGPDVSLTLAKDRQGNGSIEFCGTPDGTYKPTLKVSVPTDGSTVLAYVRGVYGSPSLADRDVSIVATTTTELGRLPVMVRVRRDANSLTTDERDRFISAMATLNNRGMGRFADFRRMHVAGPADQQAHDGPGFLPWHRSYLLDLERELQLIDPSVALPYWRFDKPAPKVFIPDFMGVPDGSGAVQFSPANPLQFWATDGAVGVLRTAVAPSPGVQAAPGLRSESNTLKLGTLYKQFRTMQGNPHGSAHTSYFFGSIASIPTAAKDPLFFLLHCNVDRLWAKWQQKEGRFDASVAASYDQAAATFKGHFINDSLWPWDGDTSPPRPSTAPGGAMATSACVSAPGLSPRVSDMLDFLGLVKDSAKLGFAYDDVAATT